MVFLALLLVFSASRAVAARDCRPEDVHFEMITGYVYSAPGEIMETSPGVLLLRDCLEQCRLNDLCRAINFETGLCVLFAGSYADQPGTGIRCSFVSVTSLWSTMFTLHTQLTET
jgi:hypothetical protein